MRCKNVGGAPRDDDDRPPAPRLTTQWKGKRKVAATKKKRMREEREAAEALTVAEAAMRAERGGRGSGLHIGGREVHLLGRTLGTSATEETEAEAEAEEPEQQTEETELPRRHSTRTRT